MPTNTRRPSTNVPHKIIFDTRAPFLHKKGINTFGLKAALIIWNAYLDGETLPKSRAGEWLVKRANGDPDITLEAFDSFGKGLYPLNPNLGPASVLRRITGIGNVQTSKEEVVAAYKWFSDVLTEQRRAEVEQSIKDGAPIINLPEGYLTYEIPRVIPTNVELDSFRATREYVPITGAPMPDLLTACRRAGFATRDELMEFIFPDDLGAIDLISRRLYTFDELKNSYQAAHDYFSNLLGQDFNGYVTAEMLDEYANAYILDKDGHARPTYGVPYEKYRSFVKHMKKVHKITISTDLIRKSLGLPTMPYVHRRKQVTWGERSSVISGYLCFWRKLIELNEDKEVPAPGFHALRKGCAIQSQIINDLLAAGKEPFKKDGLQIDDSMACHAAGVPTIAIPSGRIIEIYYGSIEEMLKIIETRGMIPTCDTSSSIPAPTFGSHLLGALTLPSLSKTSN